MEGQGFRSTLGYELLEEPHQGQGGILVFKGPAAVLSSKL
jgi:hypothetical protein